MVGGMRVVLIPLRTRPRQIEQNWAELERRLEEAAGFAPDLVCLPECALTGYLYEAADFEHFAEPLTGPSVRRLAGLARRMGSFLCAGLLERAPEGVYSAALLFDQRGNLILRHRKIEEKPPFRCGRDFRSVKTRLGRMGILVCGDLFNESASRRAAGRVDVLLVPLARSFAGRSPDPARWAAEERQVYWAAAAALKTTVCIVNALEVDVEEPAFGGALVIGADGRLLAESPHGSDELLLVEVES